MKSLPRRLIAFFACLYALSVAIVLYAGFHSTVAAFEHYLDELMTKEVQDLLRILERGGERNLIEELDLEIDELGAQDWIFLYRGPEGRAHVSKNEDTWRSSLAVISSNDFSALDRGPITLNEPRLARFIKIPNGGSPASYIVAGSTLRTLESLEHTFIETGIVSLLALTALAALGAVLVLRRVLTRIDSISGAASSLQATDPIRRLPTDGSGDEFDMLSHAINGMLQRIQDLREAFHVTADNLAHDLRTPLTRMRGSAEVALISGDSSEIPALVIEESDGLIELVNTTLEIAALEAKGQTGAGQTLNLRAIVEEALELFKTVAESKRIELSLEARGERFEISGQQRQIERAVANLIDNALKFCAEGAHASVSLSGTGAEVELEISDNGPGIPENLLSHVGERFFRTPVAKKTPGYGLGLAFVKATVTAHGGSFRVRSTLGQGTSVRLSFPATKITNR